MNAELDTQTSFLQTISSRVTLMSKKVSSIYDLLSTALADETVVLDNKSQQVAETIMQQDNSEQYWNDKNQDNFNAIGLDTFQFDNGILSGLSTVGNIFSSVWTSLGDATIIFTFPLILGIALVAIGRVARSGGKGGKGNSDNKGGDS